MEIQVNYNGVWCRANFVDIDKDGVFATIEDHLLFFHFPDVGLLW